MKRNKPGIRTTSDLEAGDNKFESANRAIADTVKILGKAKIGKGVTLHDFVTLYPNVVIGDFVEVFEGAVIGRPPRGTRAIARPIEREFRSTRIGRRSVVSANAVIYTDVTVGAETLIGDGASIREKCRIGRNCILARNVTVNYNTVIGNSTKIMDGTHITGNMTIGSNVFIGPLVATTNDNSMGREGYSDETIRGPVVEDWVSIGAGAVILPGARMGEGSVIGANSVVSHDVPPRKLVLGVPGRIIRDV